MKPEISNAINLIFTHTSKLELTRDGHQKLDQAFKTVIAALTPPVKSVKEPKKK